MDSFKVLQRPVVALSLAACLVAAGCSSQQNAIDAAKKDVVATRQPQEVIYVDDNGTTTTTMVSPPSPGSTVPTLISSTTPVGAPAIQGLPDWSNGNHPAPKHAMRYSAPGVAIGTAVAAAPGTATDPNAAPAPNGAMTAMTVPSTAMTGAPGTYANNTPAPSFVPTDVTIPAGTGLAIRINQRIDVKHTAAGARFTGELAEGVSRDGKVILPRGTRVRGVVDASHRRGHFKGRSVLELRLTSIVYNDKVYPLETADFVASKKGKGKRSAAFIGGGTGVGMLIGGIATGGVGLAVGGLAGGGLGTLLAGTTGNRDIVIPAESLVRFRLEDSLTVQPADNNAVATNAPDSSAN